MTTQTATGKPVTRPVDARFSPGPTRKFAGWTLQHLADAPLGRSHRSAAGKAKLKSAIDRSKATLGMPDDWRLGIIAGSDTGAVECAMWNLLGPRPVDVLVWEAFGKDWAVDAVDELKLDARVLKADFGALPALSDVNFDHDVILTWNGTTSGVRMPGGDAIPADRGGLVIADATSAVFAMDIPWDKVDVVTWSWQKVLGGEAAHGMMALGPRAVERIESYTPDRAIPKIYRIRQGDGLNESVFEGATLNTPSLLATEDCLAALDWADSVGGLEGLIARSRANFAAMEAWIGRTPWAEFMATDPATRSTTSLCVRIVDPVFDALDEGGQRAFVKRMLGMLAEEGAAFDIEGYRSAPPSFRIWGGGTVEASDIEALTPWLDWAFATTKAEYEAKAA
jgi:phosphoserine aminotransferase